ncbi:hypothetical protein EDD41_0413 [Luteococcus japonicus]|uniref:Uncharacterized protein n=1 Tax=Luteococcus japonicus TaxID=33984 RepID=A0A3N1ZRE8_9ACTN|nr:hypothetical protein EDD41_0413 [Luteococcus japonicus]
MLKPCAVCGELSEQSRCPEHQPKKAKVRTDIDKYHWKQLSRRARRMQPFCLLCGTTDNLQADHSPRAWARSIAGLPIRLVDVNVLCGPCNSGAGSSQPRSARYDLWEATGADLTASTPDQTLLSTQGGRGAHEASPLRGEAKFRSQLGMTPNKAASWRG